MGVNIGLVFIAGVCAVILRSMLAYQNRQLARMEDEDVQLTPKDLRKLRKTAELENIDIATARKLQKGYRYIL